MPRRPKHRALPGIRPDSHFVRHLAAAHHTAEVEALLRHELHRTTGRRVKISLAGGELTHMQDIALAVAHWAHLHPDIPLDTIHLAPIDDLLEADGEYNPVLALASRGTLTFNTNYYAAANTWRLASRYLSDQHHGFRKIEPVFATLLTTLHELAHVRHIHLGIYRSPGFLKMDAPAGDPNAASTPYHKTPDAPRDAHFTRQPSPHRVDNTMVDSDLGTALKVNKAELLAESEARLHWLGADADRVSAGVAQIAGPIETIANASVHLRDSYRVLQTSRARRDRSPIRSKMDLLAHLRQTPARHARTRMPQGMCS